MFAVPRQEMHKNKNKNKRGTALAEASGKHPRDQLLLSILPATRSTALESFLRAGTREGKMGKVTSSRPVNGGDQTGPSGVSGTPSQGIAQACRGAAFGQRAPGRIHQSDLPTAQQLWGAKRLLPCLNINPRR